MSAEHEETFNQMLIRYDCRDNYRMTGGFEHNHKYSEAQQQTWDDECKDIIKDEEQSV